MKYLIILLFALPAYATHAVDAVFGFYVERNAANDDFNNSIYVRGADMHVQSDGKFTTAKDEGTGWVKVAT